MRISAETNSCEKPEASKAITIPIVSGATGPRTKLGKRRESRNSVKHGLFSKVVVLESESQAEFKGLWAELWEDCRPVGKREELLVEKLAYIIWRLRRLLLAERAEVEKRTKFLICDRALQLLEDAPVELTGAWIKANNRKVNAHCQVLLTALQVQINACGLDLERDTNFLRSIYTPRTPDVAGLDLYDYYFCVERSKASEKKHLAEQCKQEVLRAIKKEIGRLKTRQELQTAMNVEREPLEVASRGVPDAQTLDALLRYETTLNRDFDRTLGQLERLQRTRMGQSIPPRIEVELKR
jgi:hypothetical protein